MEHDDKSYGHADAEHEQGRTSSTNEHPNRYYREAYDLEEVPLLAALPRFELLKRLTILREHATVKEQMEPILSLVRGEAITLSNEEVLRLEAHVLRIQQDKFERQYGERGPFRRTPPEKIFVEYAKTKVAGGSLLYKESEVADPLSRGVLIGPSTLDVLLLGWTAPGYDAVAFEINGRIHELKHAKDRVREYWIAEVLGILVIPIENRLVHKDGAAEGCEDFERVYLDRLFGSLRKVPKDVTELLRTKIALINIAVHGGSLGNLEQLIEMVLGRKLPLRDLFRLVNRRHRPKWTRTYRNFDSLLRAHRKKRKFSRGRSRLGSEDLSKEPQHPEVNLKEPSY